MPHRSPQPHATNTNNPGLLTTHRGGGPKPRTVTTTERELSAYFSLTVVVNHGW